MCFLCFKFNIDNGMDPIFTRKMLLCKVKNNSFQVQENGASVWMDRLISFFFFASYKLGQCMAMGKWQERNWQERNI